MAIVPVSIRLDVTQQADGTFTVTYAANGTLPPHVTVSADEIELHSPAKGDEAEYSLEFLLPPGYQYGTPAILWPNPPNSGLLSGLGTSFGGGPIVEPGGACALPVTIPGHQPGIETYQPFFFIEKNVVVSQPRISFIADPTIVTDPDPG